MRWLLTLSWIRWFLGQRFQWYRRWYGGRWERHWIDICGAYIWLEMRPDPKFQWPAYRQPCSYGTPLIEDYPVKESTHAQ